MGDGADYGQEAAYEAAELDKEMAENELDELTTLMLNAYRKGKEALVGDDIYCPCCGTKFKKKTYNQVFDSNKCKDRYWNTTDDDRRKRARDFNK